MLQKNIALKKQSFDNLIKFSNENNYFTENRKHDSKLSEVIQILKHQQKDKKKLSFDCKEMRENLFDWLLVVNKKLKLTEYCFLLNLEMIDTLMELDDHYTYEQLYLISVTVLFIASKFEELTPILINTLLTNVCHNKLTKKQVLESEIFILKKLNFKLPKSHFVDFSILLIEGLFEKNVKIVEKKVSSQNSSPDKNIFFKANDDQGKLSSMNSYFKKKSEDIVSDASSIINNMLICEDNFTNSFSQEQELELNQFKNVVFLYSITIHKLLKFEYNIMKKYKNLEVYFGIMYFCCKNINMLFCSKFEIQERAIFDISELNGISKNNILNVYFEIYKFNKEISVHKNRFQFLLDLELSKFQI